MMKNASHKNKVPIYELKKGSCPVNGMNTYSVFKNGTLVFMMDGDRPSFFRPEEVYVLSEPDNDEVRVYIVGEWVFTGRCSMTSGLKKLVPKKYVVCSALD